MIASGARDIGFPPCRGELVSHAQARPIYAAEKSPGSKKPLPPPLARESEKAGPAEQNPGLDQTAGRRRDTAKAETDAGRKMAEKEKRNRPDHDGTHRLAFERNKKKILATQTLCGICGQPVDKRLKYPHPMSPCIDHIIPIDRSGHPSDMDNLQLAHWICNRSKGNKLAIPKRTVKTSNEDIPQGEGAATSNRDLPLSMDWGSYKSRT